MELLLVCHPKSNVAFGLKSSDAGKLGKFERLKGNLVLVIAIVLHCVFWSDLVLGQRHPFLEGV